MYMKIIRLPKFNENMQEATILEWRVSIGDNIEEGDPLVEIATDKATFTYESPECGTFLSELAAPNSTIPITYAICALGSTDETIPETLEEENKKILSSSQNLTLSSTNVNTKWTPAKKVRATPKARRIAKDANINLADVVSRYKIKGVISDTDVHRFIEDTK